MAGDDAVVAEGEEGDLQEETALFGRAKIGRAKRTLPMVRRALPLALQRRGGKRSVGERVEVRRFFKSEKWFRTPSDCIFALTLKPFSPLFEGEATKPCITLDLVLNVSSTRSM